MNQILLAKKNYQTQHPNSPRRATETVSVEVGPVKVKSSGNALTYITIIGSFLLIGMFIYLKWGHHKVKKWKAKKK